VEEFLTVLDRLETIGTVGHETLTLSRTDGTAEVRLARLAELAFAALGSVELFGLQKREDGGEEKERKREENQRKPLCFVLVSGTRRERESTHRNDVVSNLNVRNALTNRLYDTSTLVSENDGERTLGVVAGEL
jgi:hypothetical protein